MTLTGKLNTIVLLSRMDNEIITWHAVFTYILQSFCNLHRISNTEQTTNQNHKSQREKHQLLLMRSAGGAITSIDTNDKKQQTQKGLLKSPNQHATNDGPRRRPANSGKRRGRGEMKLLEKYLDELQRNKSYEAARSTNVLSASDFESVFTKGGVKISKIIRYIMSGFIP